MYKILLLTSNNNQNDLRQTPEGKGVVLNGKYQFYLNEPIKDPDFLVVRNKAFKEAVSYRVAPANTILLTSEPYDILAYPKGYCKQFGLVCSCQENLKLPNVIYTPAILPWYVGVEFTSLKVTNTRLSYEDILKSKPEKEKLISVITSNKAFTKGHLDRLRFVEKLQNYYGDRIDVFGRGHRGFSDKWDVLSPYKYHIAIENTSSRYYWTEKLSDCYLTSTYPIYYGCTNVGDYFPEGAFTGIDIRNFEQTVGCIDRVLAEDRFAKSQEALVQSKHLVLSDYNMFNFIANLCEQLDAHASKETVTLKAAHDFFDFHNLYLHTLGRTFFKLKSKMQGRRLNK